MPIIPISASASPHGAIVPIATGKITNTTSTDITFTNIPQIYRDLMLVGTARKTDANQASTLYPTPYYSGIPASPQSNTVLEGTGTGMQSFRYSNQDGLYHSFVPALYGTTGYFAGIVWHCLNYANTTTFKTTICRTAADNNGSGTVRLSVGLTRGTGGMTTINITTFSGSSFLVPGTAFTLYGIRSVGL
jgi:hypothetical protein